MLLLLLLLLLLKVLVLLLLLLRRDAGRAAPGVEAGVLRGTRLRAPVVLRVRSRRRCRGREPLPQS